MAGRQKQIVEAGKEKEKLLGFHDVDVQADSLVIAEGLNDKASLLPSLPPAKPQVRLQLSTQSI